MWDVEKVLTFLRQAGVNELLPLKALSAKLAMLLALVLAHRSSDLVRLLITGRQYLPHAVSIHLTGLAKQARPGHLESLQPVVVSAFESEPFLCPTLELPLGLCVWVWVT